MAMTRRSAMHYQTAGDRGVLLVWVGAVALAVSLAIRLPHDVGTVALFAWALSAGLFAVARPRAGLYVFVIGTMLIEQNDPIGGVPLVNAQVPFFWDSSGFTDLMLPVSPAEVLLGAIVLGWLIRGLRTRQGLGLRRNALLVPTLLYASILLFGAAHGLFTGGDFKVALWEIRGPLYTIAMVLLVPALVKRRSHLNTLVWIVLIGVIFIALEGLWVAGIELGWRVSLVDTIVGHDDAVHIAYMLVLLTAMLVVGGDRRQRQALIVMAPVLIFVLFATQRRDAFIALGLGLFVVAALTVREHPRTAARFVAVLAAVLAIYGAAYLALGPEHQVFVQPVRAISSAYAPATARDIASNGYRTFENAGMRSTIRGSPIFGVGFGQRYDVPPQVFNIGVPLYQYITHDDILRVWAKAGTIGFIVYWVFVGATIIEGTRVYRRLHDGRLKALAMFAVCVVAMELVIHSVDMAMTFYRSMTLVGVAVGCMLTLERIERAEVAE